MCPFSRHRHTYANAKRISLDKVDQSWTPCYAGVRICFGPGSKGFIFISLLAQIGSEPEAKVHHWYNHVCVTVPYLGFLVSKM